MNLTKEIREAEDQSQRGPGEEHADKPPQFRLQQDLQEEGHDDSANEKCRERARGDCRARQVAPALEALKLELNDGFILKVLRQRVLGQPAATINDSSQAPCHDIQDACDTGEQEDRRERELDGVSHVTDVYCHVRFWAAEVSRGLVVRPNVGVHLRVAAGAAG